MNEIEKCKKQIKEARAKLERLKEEEEEEKSGRRGDRFIVCGNNEAILIKDYCGPGMALVELTGPNAGMTFKTGWYETETWGIATPEELKIMAHGSTVEKITNQ